MNFKKGFSMSIRNVLAMLAVGCTVSSCAYPPAASLDAPKDVKTNAAHLVNPGTTIGLSVYGEESLTGEFVVDHNGDLTLPMIGEVAAQGFTKAQLRKAIQDELKAARLISNPVVSLNILAPRPIYILGEVNVPGEYPYKPNMDIFEAISIAGGYTPRASRSDVLIGRRQSQDKTIYNGEEDTLVLPGDSITVRERIF
jgi:polysaccharide export outer membrane protein